MQQSIQNDVDQQWPEGYFDLFGSREGEALQRPTQGDFEQREVLQSANVECAGNK